MLTVIINKPNDVNKRKKPIADKLKLTDKLLLKY